MDSQRIPVRDDGQDADRLAPQPAQGTESGAPPDEIAAEPAEASASAQAQAQARAAEARLAVADLSRESTQFLASLGRTIRDTINQALEGRSNVVMVRVNDDTLRAIDELVQAGLFRTRSEAAAYLLLEGMRARSDVLHRISDTARRIEELRAQLREALHGEVPAAQPGDAQPAATPEA